LGARFTEYTAEFESGGELGPTAAQRFLYVFGGELKLEVEGRQSELKVRGYAYLPEGLPHRVVATRASRAAIIEKTYQPLALTEAPRAIISNEDAVSSHALDDDPSLQVKCLLPDTMQFDFAVNSMVYQPGAALSMVEMHIMEHGLLMLEGGGIYRLDDSWYPVTAGDFIWMGPWCPQWFGAIGKVPAKYLIYKDTNRHPLSDTRQTDSSR
jgi:(S)-ureidoglycine aminohydrolase